MQHHDAIFSNAELFQPVWNQVLKIGFGQNKPIENGRFQ